MRTAINNQVQAQSQVQVQSEVQANIKSTTSILKEVTTQEEDGMYLEVKYTLRRPAKGRGNSLCTLIGKSSPAGNISNNTKDSSIFFHSWLRPLVWKKEEGPQVDIETGDLARTDVNAFLVRKASIQIDPSIAAFVSAIEKNPEAAPLVLGMLPTSSQELVKAALETKGGYERKKANLSVLLDKLFGHQSVRIKATLYGEFKGLADYINDLEWNDDEGHAKDYSLVIRFPLVESLNGAAELKEMYDKGNDQPYFIPGTINPIMYKEVYIYPSYIGVLKGAERTKDLTKMISTQRVISAFEAAWVEASEAKKTFLSDARLDNEASQVNAWKSIIAAKTGKKWADTFKNELFALAPQVAAGNSSAAKEADNILTALGQVATEGTNERVTVAEANKFSTAFDKAVEEAKAVTPEPIKEVTEVVEETSTSNDTDEFDWDDILSAEGIIVDDCDDE
jgi:hypothetical protein